MHKRYPRSSDLRFSTDPQNVLKFLKRSSKPSKSSSEVHVKGIRQSRSNDPQSPQNFLKTVINQKFRQRSCPTGLSKSPQKVHKVLKSQENAQKVPKVLRPQVLNWSSKCPQKFPKNSPQMLSTSTRSHQKFLKVFFNVLRASGPQVFKKSSKGPTKSSKSQENAQKVPKVLRPQVLNWSSKWPPQKGIKALKSPHRPTKRIQGDFKVLKNLSTSSKSSEGNQVRKIPNVLKSHCNPQSIRSSIASQEVIKSSWKWFFNVLRASGPQVFKKSSKGPATSSKSQENAQKVPKVLRPQNLLKFLKRSSKPSKSSEVHKRYSSRHQRPQEVINVVKILWASKVPQMFIKWSSKSPQNFLKTVLKWSTRSHQKFQKGSSMFWEHQVLRSLRSPKKVHKVLKKSRKCTNGTQGLQTSGSQLILKMSSNSSKGYQSPRSPHRSTKRIQGDFKVLKYLSTSPKSSVGNQVRKILNVLKSYCKPKSIRSSIGSQAVIKRSWKILQRSESIRSSGLPKFLKGSRKSSKSQENAQKVPKVLRPQVLNWSSKCPQIPQKVIKALEFFNVLRKSGPQVFQNSSKDPESPQKVKKMHKRYPRSSDLRFSTDPQNVLKFLKRSSKPSKSSEVHKRPQNPVVVKRSSNGHQMVLTESSKVLKNSPQMFHKESSKVPERFFNVLRSSCLQVFKQSSKGPQSPQKVKKMHKRYPRSSDLRFSTDPQNVLKFLKRLSKPSKSS